MILSRYSRFVGEMKKHGHYDLRYDMLTKDIQSLRFDCAKIAFGALLTAASLAMILVSRFEIFLGLDWIKS